VSQLSISTHNFILSALDAAELAEVKAASSHRDIRFGEVVCRPGEPVEAVVFPDSGVISLITLAPDGTQAEAAVTGPEGGAGLIEALGSGVSSTTGTVQAAGSAWLVPRQVCLALYESSATFRHAAALSAEFQTIEARQSMHCRSYHVTQARLARWLLEMRDKGRIPGDRITLTQEFLSMMLGVQRTTVSTIAGAMKAEGLISFSRGLIELRDTLALEAQACVCRAELRDQYRRIICQAEDDADSVLAPPARPHAALSNDGWVC
jgi:CRP-like cAMP-binding protein